MCWPFARLAIEMFGRLLAVVYDLPAQPVLVDAGFLVRRIFRADLEGEDGLAAEHAAGSLGTPEQELHHTRFLCRFLRTM